MLDVDECQTSNGECAEFCNNTDGSFECSCRTGYMLAADDANCNGMTIIITTLHLHIYGLIDIDECLTNNGGCAQTCTNTDGSFECSCGGNYILAADGLDCDGMCSYHKCN